MNPVAFILAFLAFAFFLAAAASEGRAFAVFGFAGGTFLILALLIEGMNTWRRSRRR